MIKANYAASIAGKEITFLNMAQVMAEVEGLIISAAKKGSFSLFYNVPAEATYKAIQELPKRLEKSGYYVNQQGTPYTLYIGW
jgi:hypothetical protein